MVKERLSNLNNNFASTLSSMRSELDFDFEELTILDIRQKFANLAIYERQLAQLQQEYMKTEDYLANS